jgi:hypothetical protein
MPDLPTGTVPVLFTDIESSTVGRGVIDRGAKRRWTRVAVRAEQMGVDRGT